MQHTLVRRAAAIGLLGTLLLGFPAATAATITPPCSGTGLAASGNVDLTTATEWHLHRDDLVSGEGSTTIPMKSATVSAYAFGGLGIPIASASGDGGTEGSVTALQVSTFAVLGSRFYVAGVASGDGGSCSGNIVVIIDDVSPVVTVLGGGAIALTILCLLGVVIGMRANPTVPARVFFGLLGLIGGSGLALAAGQFGILDASSTTGLILPVVGALAGYGLCGLLRPKRPIAAAA